MEFVGTALDYLLGILSFLGLGTQIGFVWKGAGVPRRAADLHRLHPARRPQDLGGGADPPRPQRRRRRSACCSRFADLLKFVLKEPVIPAGADKVVFLLAPLVTSILALAAWAVIPIDAGWALANINVGILYIFAISSLGVYGIIMGGWASNSKYAFLGALRSAAQMV